ncbi:MAG: hypothetical protein HY901_28375 [Deltaproteobacteria bacterium]|nr:hypothetical protein [Deltaproteobacteria bacterium]
MLGELHPRLKDFATYVSECVACTAQIFLSGTRQAASGRCNRCGHRQAVVIHTDPPTAAKLDQYVAVYARWAAERPTAKELSAVRKLVPSLAEVPISELMSKVGHGKTFTIGEFPNYQVETELRKTADHLGIHIEFAPLPVPSGPSRKWYEFWKAEPPTTKPLPPAWTEVAIQEIQLVRASE